MSKSFSNPKDLLKYLQQEIAKSMSSDVAPTVKKVQSKQVEDKVFKPYKPFRYDRRDEDGLDDPDNMIHAVKETSNGVELSIENKTTGFNDTSFEIAGLVEYGHQNGYGEYDWDYNRAGTADKFLSPRKFIEGTVDELDRTGEHVDALKRSLRGKGMDVR